MTFRISPVVEKATASRVAWNMYARGTYLAKRFPAAAGLSNVPKDHVSHPSEVDFCDLLKTDEALQAKGTVS